MYLIFSFADRHVLCKAYRMTKEQANIEIVEHGGHCWNSSAARIASQSCSFGTSLKAQLTAANTTNCVRAATNLTNTCPTGSALTRLCWVRLRHFRGTETKRWISLCSEQCRIRWPVWSSQIKLSIESIVKQAILQVFPSYLILVPSLLIHVPWNLVLVLPLLIFVPWNWTLVLPLLIRVPWDLIWGSRTLSASTWWWMQKGLINNNKTILTW